MLYLLLMAALVVVLWQLGLVYGLLTMRGFFIAVPVLLGVAAVLAFVAWNVRPDRSLASGAKFSRP